MTLKVLHLLHLAHAVRQKYLAVCIYLAITTSTLSKNTALNVPFAYLPSLLQKLTTCIWWDVILGAPLHTLEYCVHHIRLD